ncbi:NAD(+) diphosphatase [Okibacterium endophyticum]
MTLSEGRQLTIAVPPLSRGAVDRDYRTRSQPELLADLEQNPDARILPMWNGRMLVGEGEIVLVPRLEHAGEGLSCYLGRTIGPIADTPSNAPVRLVVLADDEAKRLEPDEARWRGLRELAGTVGDDSVAFATAAVALANWHGSSRFCPRCGSETVIEQSGWARRCTSCNNETFPRTDPAIIVVVTDDDDRLLLGSNVLWEQGRYSLLAGFVEAGESLEQGVVREISEECGLEVIDPTYRGSQPWPFPRSLMLGFAARVAPGQNPDDLEPDGDEIADLRWFTRHDLRHDSAGVLLPGTSSIARTLIEQWLAADGGPGLDEQTTGGRR